MYLAAFATASRSGSGMAMGVARGTTADFVLVPLVFVGVLLVLPEWVGALLIGSLWQCRR